MTLLGDKVVKILMDHEKTEETAKYTTRQTAGGVDIVDDALAYVKKIQGDTVKSTNLLPYPYVNKTKTTNGITFTDNGDGTITVNGTATANAEFILSNTEYLPKYYERLNVSAGTPTGASADTYYLYSAITGHKVYTDYYWGGGARNFSRLQIVVKAGATANNVVFKPMVYEGGTFLSSYIPYFSGLKHAYFNGIKSTGRNLFTFENSNISRSNCSIEINSSNDIKIDSTTTYDAVVCSGWRIRNLIVGKKYILSGKATIKNTPEITRSNEILISSKDESGSWVIGFKGLAGDQNQASFNFSFIATANTQRMYFYSNISEFAIFTNYSARLYDIQIEADEQTQFNPYVEDIFQLSEPVELPKWDYIDNQNKTVVRATKQHICTGNEFWVESSTAVSGKYRMALFLTASGLPLHKRNGIISNRYPTDTNLTTSYNQDSIAVGEGEDFLYVYDDRYITKGTWKAYLESLYAAGTPLIIEYETLHPIIEEGFTTADVPETHKAWNGGSETNVQGATDNSIYGAELTVTKEYLTKLIFGEIYG